MAVHRDKVKQAIQRGLDHRPEAIWVCVEPKSDRMTHDVMISLGIDPVVLPLNDCWRYFWKQDSSRPIDNRRQWRDLEMLHLCDELVVFHKRTGHSPWRDRAKSGMYTDKLVIVELGKERKQKLAA